MDDAEFQEFFKKHDLHLKANWEILGECCDTILQFLYEYRIPLSANNYQYIKDLHHGLFPDDDNSDEFKWDYEWAERIQALKMFPPRKALIDQIEIIKTASRMFHAQFREPEAIGSTVRMPAAHPLDRLLLY